MSAVDACMTIFLSDALETFVWKRGFHPTVASVRRRFRWPTEQDVRQTLHAAGLQIDDVKYSISPTYTVVYKWDSADYKNAVERDRSDKRQYCEIETFNKCVKSMRKTIYPKILSEMRLWDECICISAGSLSTLFDCLGQGMRLSYWVSGKEQDGN
jgi:hypothetical protein